MRTITCINEDNVSLTFGETFSPFLLLYCDGIYGVQNNVSLSENTMVDGSTYLGSVTKMRNIVLGLADKENHAKNRNLLYQVFKPKTKGVFIYKEVDGEYEESRTIEYIVESLDIDSQKNVRTSTVSLICPDPFFRDLQDVSITMAAWESYFEFAHEFLDEKEEFSSRKSEKLKEIFNDSAADNIGIKVEMIAEGNVSNPILYHVESNIFIKIGTNLKPLKLVRGDKVVITTETNNKNVYLERDGVITGINEYLDEESEFIQLQHGKNNLRYGADSGEDYLIVDVSFRYRYLGV